MRRTFRSRIKDNILSKVTHHTVFDYPTPMNLSYNWNFGVMALFILIIQIVTGVFLAMFYVSHGDYSFESVEYLMREVNFGAIIRYLHANGATFFFVIVYSHILRGLYYGSYLYPRQILWVTGVLLLLLMVMTAFMGYVLPWGQMSYWGATVISNLLSVTPLVGETIVQMIWGAFTVDSPTLKKFFSLHYILPFIILFVSIIHVILLHQEGSNNPLGISGPSHSKIKFSPFFLIKDYFGLFVLLLVYGLLLYYAPEYAAHPDNNIKANSMVTPPHIVPEWYFLPFFAVLRSFDDKFMGVCFMMFSILILAFLPCLSESVHRSCLYRPGFRIIFWCQLITFWVLGFIGGCEATEPYLHIGRVATFFYFFTFIVMLPAQVTYENYAYNKRQQILVLTKALSEEKKKNVV